MEVKAASRNRTLRLDKDDLGLGLLLKKIDSSVTLDEIKNQVICADVLQIADSLPEKFADLLILDPPYNLTKKYGDSSFLQRGQAEYNEYFEDLLLKILPKLKDNASLYVCCDWRTSLTVGNVLSKHVRIQNRITWQREKGRGAAHNWKNSMEDIWFAIIGKDYYFNVDAVKQRRKVIAPYKVDGKPKDWEETEDGNFRNTYPSNFWDDITIPYWSMPENTEHPTQKPEKLMAKLVLASSKEGDVVFDPFLGSGTTAVVCQKLGRNFVGVEMQKEYCLLALKRLNIAKENKEIQGYNDGVFWERNTLNFMKKST